MYTIDDEVF